MRSIIEKVIGNRLNEIGDNAFYSCPFLTSINLVNVRKIGD